MKKDNDRLWLIAVLPFFVAMGFGLFFLCIGFLVADLVR